MDPEQKLKEYYDYVKIQRDNITEIQEEDVVDTVVHNLLNNKGSIHVSFDEKLDEIGCKLEILIKILDSITPNSINSYNLMDSDSVLEILNSIFSRIFTKINVVPTLDINSSFRIIDNKIVFNYVGNNRITFDADHSYEVTFEDLDLYVHVKTKTI